MSPQAFQVTYTRHHPIFNQPIYCVEFIEADSLETLIALFDEPENEGTELLEVKVFQGEL